MTELPDLPDLRELRAGATGQPAVRDASGELAELRRQQRQVGLADATPLARDATMAFREVMGDRRQRELAADSAHSQPRASTFL